MSEILIRSMLPREKSVLLVVAAPNEFRAVLEGLGAKTTPSPAYWMPLALNSAAEIVLSGVGKSNAAGAAAHCLDVTRHGAILSLGIAGALTSSTLPGRMLGLGQVIAAESCVFADEGVERPDGFADMASLGFPLGEFSGCAVPVDASLLVALREVSDVSGAVATVSTCSGTDRRAEEVARRTGAIAEGMEGAAVALVGRRLGVPAGELRVISNTTGNRDAQTWDLRTAFSRLGEVARRLVGGAD